MWCSLIPYFNSNLFFSQQRVPPCCTHWLKLISVLPFLHVFTSLLTPDLRSLNNHAWKRSELICVKLKSFLANLHCTYRFKYGIQAINSYKIHSSSVTSNLGYWIQYHEVFKCIFVFKLSNKCIFIIECLILSVLIQIVLQQS